MPVRAASQPQLLFYRSWPITPPNPALEQSQSITLASLLIRNNALPGLRNHLSYSAVHFDFTDNSL
jgi:hypothetical protein